MEVKKVEKYIAFASIYEALAEFKKQGYMTEFLRNPTRLYCAELHLWITPEQFSVDVSYYLEKISNPDQDRVFYAISSSIGVKGILVEPCGVYADNISLEMAQKLSVVNYQAFEKIQITDS
jgi:hypothetical protein